MIGLILYRLINLYSIILVIYVLMSWIPRSSSGWVEDLRSVLASVSEPYLGLFRRIIPPMGMIDFSPVVAIIVLQIVERLALTVF